ncbi:MAG: UDP-N-acetylmuramate dehydrogenase [Parcubacteria group bacterium]|nr:UDP-N-acetylmuramate dehydrogenase [Parcubacteria group bacterium]
MKIEENISLKEFNIFKVGGVANYFCRVSSIDELKQVVQFARQKELEIFILGSGSNILVSDDGFGGLVIKIELKGVELKDNRLIISAGESWDDIVKLSVEKSLYGIENMSFIPGTVGAGVAGNIGAYGSEIKDVVEYVEVFDIDKLKTFKFNNKQCKFKYRESIFKKKNFIITKVYVKLLEDSELNTTYKDIQNYSKENNITFTLKTLRQAIREIRNNKFPNLSKYGTAGSFFKNPIIEGNKLHLAKILDELGMKGLREGDVALYKNQPLVVVNLGEATAKEIKKFTDNVAQKVFNKKNIKIIPEIVFIGEF